MEDRHTFELFQAIQKASEESLEQALVTAETYDMSEKQAVDLGLKQFFLKLTESVGKQQVLSYLNQAKSTVITTNSLN